MLFVQTAIRLELIKENKMTNREDQIRDILFKIGTEIKLHKVDSGNFIIEIDYEKYVKLILGVIDSTTETLE